MTHEEMSRRGGLKGGRMNTEAQKRARSENGKKATGRPKGSRGGARPGSGRKPSPEPLVLIQIRVPKSVADAMGPSRAKFAREAISEKLRSHPHD